MSKTVALARASVLREALLDHGVKAVSIELVEGRGGQGWDMATHRGTMGHHIASRRTQGLTPFLNLVKVGRSDLPGPLANAYGGWDETARIICMSWANHAGEGGPYTLPAGTVPANNGRPYFFGWEFEGGIDIADFTDSYRTFMARCLAGTLDFLGQPVEAHIEHKTWAPGRKSDRLGYTLTRARQEITEALDMAAPLQPYEQEAIDALIAAGVFTTFTVDAPGEVDELVSVRKLAVYLRRLLSLIAALEAGGGGGDTETGHLAPFTATITPID